MRGGSPYPVGLDRYSKYVPRTAGRRRGVGVAGTGRPWDLHGYASCTTSSTTVIRSTEITSSKWSLLGIFLNKSMTVFMKIFRQGSRAVWPIVSGSQLARFLNIDGVYCLETPIGT